MEWIKAIAELIKSFAWSGTALVIIWIFRRELRQRVTSLTEVKYPGGSITMKEVQVLEGRVVESVASDKAPLPRSLAYGASPVPSHDPQIAIAYSRIEVERELFRLSLVTLAACRT
jgi:hypothetical protein